MGLFDFIKKDKKNKKDNDKKDKKEEKSIDFSSIDNVSPEDLKNAKEKRLKNDSRSKEDILKDETFREIAKNHSNRNNRIAAVMEMKSQDVLEDLAMDNKDRYVRTISASRITDPNILEELAYNAKYSDVRQIAFDKLGKVNHVLGEIAKYDKKGKDRLDAVREIDDELVLMDLCLNAKDQKVRMLAIEKIENNQILTEILKISSENKIFNKIINKESFCDEEILSDIAKSNEYDKFIRVEALNKLDTNQNNETIKEIAFNEMDEHVCSAAIEKVDSEDDLIE